MISEINDPGNTEPEIKQNERLEGKKGTSHMVRVKLGIVTNTKTCKKMERKG